MEKIGKQIMEYLDPKHDIWDELDRMRMVLGIEIFIHNILMISSILIFAKVLNIFCEACILLTGYGILKIKAGGIHLKSSLGCLTATGTFIVVGVMIAKKLALSFRIIGVIYIICLGILMVIGPQGTTNNPILANRRKTLKIQIFFVVNVYLICSFFTYGILPMISYLLLVALIFETISIMPSYIKSRQ